VIVRTSDFNTNEYPRLLGGARFEPKKENPMLGWCGASRYYTDGHRAGFALECRGLTRGKAGLEVYVMCEIPSNVVLEDSSSRRVRASRAAATITRVNGR